MPKSIEDILNETLAPEMKASLQEAFDAKVSAMRVEIEESVRDELATRYEHDKNNLLEATDRMLTDVIRVHESAKAEEIAKLSEARNNYKKAIKEHKDEMRQRLSNVTEMATKFVTESVTNEVKALRDQKITIANEAASLTEGVETVKAELLENHAKHIEKINEFVTRRIAAEIKEFAEDKRALVEARVKLISENKKKLSETQSRFIKEAASKVETMINETLGREMRQLHEDVERYRENQFGRELFEAFASTYMASHLSEGSEVRKLQKVLEAKEAAIAEANAAAETVKEQLAESEKKIADAQRKVVVVEERAQRNKIMSELLSSLRGDRRAVMESMLETTKTANLKTAFEKLLPVVLSEGTKKNAPTGKNVLSESKHAPAPVVTGDRQIREDVAALDEDQSIAEIVHLAGIKRK